MKRLALSLLLLLFGCVHKEPCAATIFESYEVACCNLQSYRYTNTIGEAIPEYVCR